MLLQAKVGQAQGRVVGQAGGLDALAGTSRAVDDDGDGEDPGAGLPQGLDGLQRGAAGGV